MDSVLCYRSKNCFLRKAALRMKTARLPSFNRENFTMIKFFWAWFSPEHDRNRDGVPEWDHILQTGFEDNPLFDVWHPWSQGLDIS